LPSSLCSHLQLQAHTYNYTSQCGAYGSEHIPTALTWYSIRRRFEASSSIAHAAQLRVFSCVMTNVILAFPPHTSTPYIHLSVYAKLCSHPHIHSVHLPICPAPLVIKSPVRSGLFPFLEKTKTKTGTEHHKIS
jgi:hypothetical protein